MKPTLRIGELTGDVPENQRVGNSILLPVANIPLTHKIILHILPSQIKHIYRVNGYCGTTQPDHTGPSFQSVLKEKNPESAWVEVLLLYKEYMSDKDTIEPDICFAWEVSTQHKVQIATLIYDAPH
jgi:hypothetical protein